MILLTEEKHDVFFWPRNTEEAKDPGKCRDFIPEDRQQIGVTAFVQSVQYNDARLMAGISLGRLKDEFAKLKRYEGGGYARVTHMGDRLGRRHRCRVWPIHAQSW